MKKAFALILALVMCLSVGMMAFAEAETKEPYVDGKKTITSSGDATTNVDILVNSTNISVTVPLRYAVVADVAGGPCMVPAADAYYIQNNSAIPVDVTEAKVEPTSSNDKWELVAAATATVPSDKNQISMTLTPDGEGTAWNLANKFAADWTVDAASPTEATKLLIGITANSSMLNTTDDQPDAFVITYTFAAAE